MKHLLAHTESFSPKCGFTPFFPFFFIQRNFHPCHYDPWWAKARGGQGTKWPSSSLGGKDKRVCHGFKRLPSFLPSFLLSFLPSFLPSFFPSFLPSFFPSFPPLSLPSLTGSCSVTNAGVQWQDHCSLNCSGSNNPPASVTQLAGTTGQVPPLPT